MNSSDNRDNDELQQQQVLFIESDTSVEQADTSFKDNKVGENYTKQVIFDNHDYSPIAVDENYLDKEEQAELNSQLLYQDIEGVQGSKTSWFWRTVTVIFLTLVAIEAFDFFIVGFEHSPITTGIYALLLALISLFVGNSLLRELIGLKQFKYRQQLKKQATDIMLTPQKVKLESDNKYGKLFCDNISESLPCDLVFDNAKEQQLWHDAVSNEHSSAELVQLYSRVVLSKVDEKALNEVAKFSSEAVVLVALSPVALIDMLIMLSRNLRMINKVAGLYGLKLGYWSRIKLIKQVFVNMAYAGASELIADFGTDMLGAELLGKLSTRFAQGLGAGMLTARLGAKTMELCRPIPFNEKPKLSQVRKKIAQQIKTLLNA